MARQVPPGPTPDVRRCATRASQPAHQPGSVEISLPKPVPVRMLGFGREAMVSSTTPRQGQTRVTINDLAADLGLAKGTVSRALNGYPEIAAGTRLRVARAAERLGYRPLAQAQAIRDRARPIARPRPQRRPVGRSQAVPHRLSRWHQPRRVRGKLDADRRHRRGRDGRGRDHDAFHRRAEGGWIHLAANQDARRADRALQHQQRTLHPLWPSTWWSTWARTSS